MGEKKRYAAKLDRSYLIISFILATVWIFNLYYLPILFEMIAYILRGRSVEVADEFVSAEAL